MGCVKSKRTGVVEEFTGSTDLNPPIKPPKNNKSDIVPPPETFAAIDKHALQSPSSARLSVASLAQYLIKPTRNDLEKVRAIYRWITDNISYDTGGFFSGNYGPQNADTVLQRGTGVCDGYACLFSALCKQVGIPCKKVSGFSKAFGYDPEVPFTLNSETDHSWNIVFLNGEWRPVETTWGAGHINSTNQYEKCFEEFYFLTDPEEFVIKHFPFHDKDLNTSLPLQLLKKPWSLEKFNKTICPQKHGIQWSFESPSHNTQVITVDKETEITFRTRKVVLQGVLCDLKERNTQNDCSEYVLLRKKGDKFSVKVTPPAKGKYELQLYGKPIGSTSTTHQALIKYVIQCQSVYEDIKPYPKKGGVWGVNTDPTRYGFTQDIFQYDVMTANNEEMDISIKTDRQVYVSFKLVHAENTESDLKRYVFGSYDGKILTIKARFPYAGFYKLTLFAKDPDKETTTHEYVADFLIHSKKTNDSVKPFPGTFTTAQKYACLLIQPLIGDLQPNQEVSLKMRSEKLVRIMINKKVHKKGANGEFDVTFETPGSGETVGVYGSPDQDGSLDQLFVYNVV